MRSSVHVYCVIELPTPVSIALHAKAIIFSVICQDITASFLLIRSYCTTPTTSVPSSVLFMGSLLRMRLHLLLPDSGTTVTTLQSSQRPRRLLLCNNHAQCCGFPWKPDIMRQRTEVSPKINNLALLPHISHLRATTGQPQQTTFFASWSIGDGFETFFMEALIVCLPLLLDSWYLFLSWSKHQQDCSGNKALITFVPCGDPCTSG